MARNERTSPRVAKVASKYARMSFDDFVAGDLFRAYGAWDVWVDLKTLAASALTQAPDKPKRKQHLLYVETHVGKPLSRKRILKKVRETDRARAAYRESVEATATSPADRPRRKAKRAA